MPTMMIEGIEEMGDRITALAKRPNVSHVRRLINYGINKQKCLCSFDMDEVFLGKQASTGRRNEMGEGD